MTEHNIPELLATDQPSPKFAIYTKAPLIGCASGGCLLPVLLFVFAAVSGDMGGPLFWPIAVVFLGIVGAAIGAFYGLIKWSSVSRKSTSFQIQPNNKPNKSEMATPRKPSD